MKIEFETDETTECTAWFYVKNNEKIYHRDDGPAIYDVDGNYGYYKHGQLHRENDLPAMHRVKEGVTEYCINDKRHRSSGPAVIRSDGGYEYFQNGKRHREGGPAIYIPNPHYLAFQYGWFNYGAYHRIAGPAILYKDGGEDWYVEDNRHRYAGPAIIRLNEQQFWLHGFRFTKAHFKEITKSKDPIKISMEFYKRGHGNIDRILKVLKHFAPEKTIQKIKTLYRLAG